jgi:hypothetical protein
VPKIKNIFWNLFSVPSLFLPSIIHYSNTPSLQYSINPTFHHSTIPLSHLETSDLPACRQAGVGSSVVLHHVGCRVQRARDYDDIWLFLTIFGHLAIFVTLVKSLSEFLTTSSKGR